MISYTSVQDDCEKTIKIIAESLRIKNKKKTKLETMRATIKKLPWYNNEDMKDMVLSISRRTPLKDALFYYKYNKRVDRMHLYCKCNICNNLLGKYIVDDFGVPMKVLFEKEEHPCLPRRS